MADPVDGSRLGRGAGELFLARATAASSDFAVGEDGLELVNRICAQLDGIPLAIELAAARVGHLSLAELEAGLDERFSLLSGGRRARRQRQQTLQAMMDWSWDLLDDDEQRMLTELAVFRGGFDVRGVDEVCAAPQAGSRFDERFGHVVVAADGQPPQPVVGLVTGGEEQHRHVVAVLAQPSADLEPVEVRQHHVEHQQVRPFGVCDGKGATARVGRRHVEAVQAQRRAHHVRDVLLVVDDQHVRIPSHPVILPRVPVEILGDSWRFPVGLQPTDR